MTEPLNSPESREHLLRPNSQWKKIARTIIPLPQRTILALMVFLGVTLTYAMRICLSITIISTVVPKHAQNASFECPFPSDYSTGDIARDPVYTWSENMIGYILSSFYIGYAITHIPGGILSDLLGGKHVLNGCVLLTSLFTLITPLCIFSGGPYHLIVVRIIMGLVQGTMFPSVNTLLAAWIPRNERGFFSSLVYSATQVGVVISTTVSGALLSRYHSWSIVYYLFGVLGLIWGFFFNILCSSDPESHVYISDDEKAMLLAQIGQMPRTSQILDAPWSEMLLNVPLMVLVIAQCGHDFGFFVMITDFPKYLSDVLHFDIGKSGFYSAVPFAAMFVVSVLTGILSDYLIEHEVIQLIHIRRIFATLGAVLPSLGLMVASYAGCDREMAMIAFTVAMATMGFYYSGMRVNALDLSPYFAGTVMAYVNGVGALMGILAPAIVGVYTPRTNFIEYRTVFAIAFILLNSTAVLYLFFASGDIQPFNYHGKHPKPMPPPQVH